MNVKDIVDILTSKHPELTKKAVETVVKETFQTVREAILKREEVSLHGIGTFKASERKERNGVNPKTQEKIKIPGSKTVTFKVSSSVKKELNQ